MNKICLDENRLTPFLNKEDLAGMEAATLAAAETLKAKNGAGNDFLGWIDLPVDYDKDEFARIKAAAARIRETSKALVVIGIGGSYLGARAAITFLNGEYGFEKQDLPIYYAGNQLSTSYLNKLVETVKDIDFSVNVISKSGTTTEPAIAFRIFKNLLEKGALTMHEELRQNYRPRTVNCVRLTEDYFSQDRLNNLFEQLKRAQRQADLLVRYLDLSKAAAALTLDNRSLLIEIEKLALMEGQSEAAGRRRRARHAGGERSGLSRDPGDCRVFPPLR